MRTQLVLITAGFPFGTGETFLENEITFLADEFEHIHIVCPDTRANIQRKLPTNCTVYRFKNQLTTPDKIRAFSGIFTSEFRYEMRVVRQKYAKKVSLGIVKTALISLFQAKRLGQFLNNQFLKQNDSEKWVFYSYWCDDAAVALALLSAQHVTLKTVTRMHRWDIYFEENTYNYLPFRNLISNQLETIYSISQDGIDYAVSTWKVDESKFILSRLGVSNYLQFKIPNNKIFTLVSCSNMIPVKRVDLLAKALIELEQMPLRWVHFGDGTERLKVEKVLEKRSSKLQVEFKGRVPNIDVYNYYTDNKPNLFVNVSSSEGVPVSIMEAMSFGIPILATNVGGNREIVSESNGVLLTSNPSIAQIASEIKKIIQLSDAENKKLHQQSYQKWKNEYNADINYGYFTKSLSNG